MAHLPPPRCCLSAQPQPGLACPVRPSELRRHLNHQVRIPQFGEDKLDSVWLAKITERGSLPGSFVPPEDIRRLRTHTRYRRHLTQARTAEKARCEKLLEDAHLKLSSVITDIHGVAGRNMLTAIIGGERNPRTLAQMALTRMRGKIPQLEEALDCSFFTEEHAFILAMMLANIDHLTAQIKELTSKIETLCQPYLHQIEQLDLAGQFLDLGGEV